MLPIDLTTQSFYFPITTTSTSGYLSSNGLNHLRAQGFGRSDCAGAGSNQAAIKRKGLGNAPSASYYENVYTF